MKVAMLTGVKELDVRDIAAPELINSGDVLVQVRAVGICGSDVHNYLEGGTGSRKVVYPFIPGHEASGQVVAVGEAVTRVKPGDRIMIEPAFYCGVCDQCRAGRFNTCRKIMFLSSAGELQGCMCGQVIIPEKNCFVIPQNLSYAEATLAEPLSIALHSVKNLAGVEPEASVAVLGCGPVGLCTMLAAKAAGSQHVYATDRLAHRVSAAEKMGASWCGNPQESNVVHDILQHEPGGVDVVFECSGDPQALSQAVDLLKPGGSLVITGIPVESRIEFSIDKLRRRELTIYNVRRQNKMEEAALELLASESELFAQMITHKFSLDDAKSAFDLVAGYRDGVVKAMVVLDGV
jgi:L-iditol 2-dehydrogenase